MHFVYLSGLYSPRGRPHRAFRHVTQIVITLDNQKDAISGETVSNFHSECASAIPVKVGINTFLYLQKWGCDPTTPISNFPSHHGIGSVSTPNIIAVIRAECLRVGATRLGFSPEDARTHSLRSGRVMVMHIPNVSDGLLMAIGRWWSLGFMVNIQQQILSFSTGVSVKMSQHPWFRHL